jgi:mRNA interferase YafQ
MREIVRSAQFKRDVKRVGKRGKDMTKLRELVLLLAAGGSLPPHYRDHPLGGNWNHHRDSHIEPDWLLLYKIECDDLYLVRTGSHADIMG